MEEKEEKEIMEEKEEKEIKDIGGRVKSFFKEYGFDAPGGKAAFSVGMLVDYLLWVQRNERKAKFGEEPFWNKLHGLVLDEKNIKNIFRGAIAKLRQYRRGYPSLENIAGMHLAEAEGGEWKISKDEISYYFVLGMTLRNALKFEREENKINGGEKNE